MLAALLGSVNKERVLVYIAARKNSYAREIARFFAASLDPIQKALDNLEVAGVLVSRSIGTTRVYEFNPQYAAREELLRLVQRALELYPRQLRDKLLINRARPRRKGKPI